MLIQFVYLKRQVMRRSVLLKKHQHVFRFVEMTPGQRKIAAVIGEGLHVPKQAKQKLLDSLGALSGLVTVPVRYYRKARSQQASDSRFPLGRAIMAIWRRI